MEHVDLPSRFLGCIGGPAVTFSLFPVDLPSRFHLGLISLRLAKSSTSLKKRPVNEARARSAKVKVQRDLCYKERSACEWFRCDASAVPLNWSHRMIAFATLLAGAGAPTALRSGGLPLLIVPLCGTH